MLPFLNSYKCHNEVVASTMHTVEHNVPSCRESVPLSHKESSHVMLNPYILRRTKENRAQVMFVETCVLATMLGKLLYLAMLTNRDNQCVFRSSIYRYLISHWVFSLLYIHTTTTSSTHIAEPTMLHYLHPD